MIVDFPPLWDSVACFSTHDSQVAIPLAEMTAQQITYLYECMDSAYDAAQIHDHSKKGNYMRECASGGQSLANSERGVGMSGFAGKTDTEFFISNVLLCMIIGNPSPNILVVRTFECNAPFESLDYVRSVEVEGKKHTKSRTHNW